MVIDVFMQAMEMLREIACFFFILLVPCFGIFLGLSIVDSEMDSPEIEVSVGLRSPSWD